MLTVRDLHRPGLAPVSFDLAAGECVAVRGASGSGKTLLLRSIADLDPNQGEVSLKHKGRDSFFGPDWRRQVVYVPAESGWWGERVGEHFSDWTPAAPLAERLGIPSQARDWRVARLSTGERQRLALVRALLLEPCVLLLDEPTSGLDEQAAAAVEKLVGERLQRGAGALWVTHSREQARRMARRAFVLADGRVRDTVP